jgi:hypothetical protein
VAHFVARRIEEGRLHVIADYSRRAMKDKLHIIASKEDLGADAKQTHTRIFVATGQYITKFLHDREVLTADRGIVCLFVTS